MLNLSYISKTYFPNQTPDYINNGRCFNWAYTVYVLLNKIKCVRLFTAKEGGGHAFIKIGDRYYDAEHPTGVPHWSSLTFFINCPEDVFPIQQSVTNFISYWSCHGYDAMWSRKLVNKMADIKNGL